MKGSSVTKSKSGRLSSARGLHDAGLIADERVLDIERVEQHYTIGVTQQVRSTIQASDPNDPIAKQYIPSSEELNIDPAELSDPIGDFEHNPVTGVVHRHADRVLLKIASSCAVYCRYCFRREMVGRKGEANLSPEQIHDALSYIRANREIWEVILTGGDPLVLSARHLAPVFQNLNAMDHIGAIRIHSRVPVADPARITPELCSTLKGDKPVYIALHINHENEITPDVERAIKELLDAGCTLLSQSVMLKGVNDSAETLDALMRRLITMKIKPYYIHHPDLAPGTKHFRFSLARGMDIMRTLHGRLSGICQPSYMLDIPGGHGKVPVNESYVSQIEEGVYHIQDYKGQTHLYRDSV